MIWWRSFHNCGQMVDCRCIQGLCKNLCWMRRSWKLQHRILHQIWVHYLNNCTWNGDENYTVLFDSVSLVPSQACFPMRTKKPLNCSGIHSWKLMEEMIIKSRKLFQKTEMKVNICYTWPVENLKQSRNYVYERILVNNYNEKKSYRMNFLSPV